MATAWSNEPKRQVGNSATLMDDTSVTFDSASIPFGGAALPTTWTLETKAA